MSKRHKCNREDCLPNNINGPKVKCVKCNSQCYLKCFGFEIAEGKNEKNEYETVKLNLNGSAMYVFSSQIAFVCCDDSLSSTERKKVLKMPSTRSNSRTRQTLNDNNNELIVNELNNVKQLLSSIESKVTGNSNELNDVKSISKETNLTVIKIDKAVNLNNNGMIIETHQNNNDLIEINDMSTPKSKPSFAQILKQNTLNRSRKNTPKIRKPSMNNPSKRPRIEKPSKPTEKKGTRNIIIGLPVEPIITKKPKESKPLFDKAVRVSGLHRDTTIDDMTQYILNNTNLLDKSQFEIHKLVKKDADISLFSFVSFKVSVNNEHFDHLMDPDTWPSGNTVREFLLTPTLGDFIMPLFNDKQQEQQKQQSNEKNEEILAELTKNNSPTLMETSK